MGKKLQTIYELLSDYSEQEIDEAISRLEPEEKAIVKARYGDDLHHPQSSKDFGSKESYQFYRVVVPKIKKLIEEKRASISIETFDDTMTLVQMLYAGKKHTEICDKLGIDHQKLFEELLNLKNRGFAYSRKYYSDGSIKYSSRSSLQELIESQSYSQDKTIITDTNENDMKMLVISDLHFGNKLERLDLIYRVYNYCAKNGINIILCGGDLIDGYFTQGTKKFSNQYQQIEYFLKHYPYDKNILTFGVAGDHDFSAYNIASLNLMDICANFRHDIIIGGYNNTGINLKNDKIHLFHRIEGGFKRKTTAPIVLHGHAHKYSTSIENRTLNIAIPTLSGINQPMPSALELNVHFENGYISEAHIKQLYFGEQDVVLGESNFEFPRGKAHTLEPIKNVEPYKKAS